MSVLAAAVVALDARGYEMIIWNPTRWLLIMDFESILMFQVNYI